MLPRAWVTEDTSITAAQVMSEERWRRKGKESPVQALMDEET